ncbi:MAG: peptide chain release factor 1 [Phycisphaerae bacterium]
MLEKLGDTDRRFCEVEELMNDPQNARVAHKVVELSKERSRLLPLVGPYRKIMEIDRQTAQAKAILDDINQDSELRDMAQEEIKDLFTQREALFEEIKSALVTSDDNVISSVILEIRAGTGGEEAALFAGDLMNMYIRYAEKRGFKTEVMDMSTSDMGGFREVILNVTGTGVFSVFGYEGGGHRVQRVPKTESQGRIHTSAATVAVMPEPEEVEIDIKPEDVIESVSRAGGPGGQNVNKVSSAIRLEHVPSGIVVSMRDERSQHKNRAKAWRVLRSRLFERMQSEKKAERDQKRSVMIGSGDRSQRIRTYNFPQNRVTDHRINLDLYCLDRILMGDMDQLVEAIQTYDRRQRLQNLQV